MIKFYNTLTNKIEEFKPIKEKKVSVYICGITPYDVCHLGHARAYVTFDVIKRHFIRSGYTVKHIQNFTDVDDKIINRSLERKISPMELAKTFICDYFIQTEKLNIIKANSYPQVTQMIPNIVNFIKVLEEKGFAYNVDGDVYFSVDKFKDYGKLSKRKFEEMKVGARVEKDSKKKNPYDFILWKKTKENEPKEVSWDSFWGKGRPGWHIECSVMATTLLGDTIDIHAGGQDLIFPHHENEIAQSESCTGKQFANYWLHNGFVTVNKEKMSKSLGNFFTLKDIFNQYNPRVVRYYLLTQHYRTPLDFSHDNLNSAKSALQGLDEAYSKINNLYPDDRLFSSKCFVKNDKKIFEKILKNLKKYYLKDINVKDVFLKKINKNVKDCLDDDFSFEIALSYLHDLKKFMIHLLDEAKTDDVIMYQAKWLFEDILEGALGIKVVKQETSSDLQELLDKRNKARKNKNWTVADECRNKLSELGYKIVDNKDGSSTLVKKC